MRHSRMIALASLVVVGTMWASAQTISRFDADTEGWAVYNDGTLTWSSTVGNPPGSLKIVDKGSGTYFGFQASSAYLGNNATKYGGTLEFQMTSTGTVDVSPTTPDVFLSGGGVSLVLDLPRPSDSLFSLRSVSLDTLSDWRVGTLGGAVATEEQIRTALASVTMLRFRGEFTSGSDTAYLDNVRFLPPGYVVPPSIATVRLGRVTSGSVSSLATSDGVVFTVCKFIVPNQIVPPVSVELDAILPFAPGASFGFRSYGRVNSSGMFVQRLELWDWQNGRWDPTDFSEGPLTTTFSLQTLAATEPFERYLDNGAVRARYRVQATGPVAVALWCHEADHMAWTVEPGT